ncbi:hypothetical protein GSN00_02935 [Cylindrospermopsis raciborskii CHAB3438]|uniref:hypothetical protein n=1 Tax=Cylindrospermopsis raciborskii TaxID=77022 RepID=UPI001F1049D6|nr:hypothetical protein [Cylindrospermopsis raciborskii]MCH4903361.1 hypothetical protein [Cylindrospermopsis raciborskii CHAB3438]MEB3146711.1 hypothetical protein [Cylindrospermopsis raciborskii]
MSIENNPASVTKQALAALASAIEAKGHKREYAEAMAASIIFQADLDLRNAQLANLLGWLKQEHEEIYESALSVVESTRQEFENRVSRG